MSIIKYCNDILAPIKINVNEIIPVRIFLTERQIISFVEGMKNDLRKGNDLMNNQNNRNNFDSQNRQQNQQNQQNRQQNQNQQNQNRQQQNQQNNRSENRNNRSSF